MSNFFNRLGATLNALGGVRQWLTSPLVSDFGALSYFTTPLSILSIGGLGVVLVMKVIHLLNPLN